MSDKMRAVVATAPDEYGIQMVDIPEPGIGEVLCRVKSVALCGSDPGLFAGHYRNKGWPPHYPFIFGHEWSGEVVALGPETFGLKPGDRVAGEAHCGCGICDNCRKGQYTLCLNYGKPELGHRHYGFTTDGAYAEYGVFKMKALEKMPDGVSFDEATMCDTGGVALHAVDNANITPAGFFAVYGPGPIGNLAMQIAKSRGTRTIMVGRRERLQMAGKCGADFLVDYEKVNPVEEIMRITGGLGADEVLESAGTQDALYQSIKSVRRDGNVVVLALYPKDDLVVPLDSIVIRQLHLLGSRANPNCSKRVMELIQQKRIDVESLITHTFDLQEIKTAVDVFSHRREGAMKVIVHP